MLRIALIGCGDHSKRFHAPSLVKYHQDHPGEIALAAACDIQLPKAQAFCEQFAFAKPYADYKAMLADESIDGCICPVAGEKIVEISCHLLDAGIPCLIEKPLGTSLADARRLVEVAGKTGTAHLVSVNRRFNPYLREAVAWARAAGPIRYVRATMIRHKRREDPFIWTTAIHAVDTLTYIAGKIKTHCAEVFRTPEMTARWYTLSLDFEADCIGHVEIIPTAGFLGETYEMFGEGYRATVEIPGADGYAARCWRDKELRFEAVAADDEPQFVSNGAYQEVVDFVSMLQGRPHEGPTVADVLEASQVCFDLAEKLGAPGH